MEAEMAKRKNTPNPSKVPPLYKNGILYSRRVEFVMAALRTMPDDILENFLSSLLYECRERQGAAS
jgi:hypothetical protein